MTGWIVVGGASKDGKTFKKGLTFLAPHLFLTKEWAKAWSKKLLANPSKRLSFFVHEVSSDYLPKEPKDGTKPIPK